MQLSNFCLNLHFNQLHLYQIQIGQISLFCTEMFNVQKQNREHLCRNS
jgi:hypothetical protein